MPRSCTKTQSRRTCRQDAGRRPSNLPASSRASHARLTLATCVPCVSFPRIKCELTVTVRYRRAEARRRIFLRGGAETDLSTPTITPVPGGETGVSGPKKVSPKMV